MSGVYPWKSSHPYQHSNPENHLDPYHQTKSSIFRLVHYHYHFQLEIEVNVFSVSTLWCLQKAENKTYSKYQGMLILLYWCICYLNRSIHVLNAVITSWWHIWVCGSTIFAIPLCGFPSQYVDDSKTDQYSRNKKSCNLTWWFKMCHPAFKYNVKYPV